MTDQQTREVTPQSLAAALSTLVGAVFNGAVIASLAISVFIKAIADDHGWSHGQIGAAITFLIVGAAISAPVFGKVVDRVGPRRVLLPLTFLSGLVLATISLIGGSLPLFYGAHFLLGLSNPGEVTYNKLMSTWFFRHRGIALTSVGFGISLARFGMPPIARWIMEARGWHNAYLAFAAVELLVSFPILFAFFRERKAAPSVDGPVVVAEAHPDGAPLITVRQALRSSTYWLLVGAQAVGVFAYMGVATHALGIMTQHGVKPDTAVWGLSVIAVGGLVAHLVTGVLLDRFDTPRVILPFSIISLAGLVLLYLGHGQTVALAAILLFGVGCGGQNSMASYFATRYFGVRNFGSIYGSLFPMLTLAGAPAPFVVGAIFDRTGSYNGALLVLGAALAPTVAFILLLRPYPYPVRTHSRSAKDAFGFGHRESKYSSS